MKIKDVKINYVQYGNESGKDIVLLHGWKQNIAMMDPVGRGLQDDFRITIFDFPGFGESEEPLFGWTINNYYEVLDEFLNNLNIKNPILIGHSFGGRIAMVYASEKPVNKLVLFSAPYRRTNKKATIKMKILKFMKKIPIINKLENYMKTKIGSRDYRNATPIMRKVLVNVVNTNLIDLLPKIKCPTLIIWGSKDDEVPLKEADYMDSIIKDSGLVVYDGCSHFAYLERLDQTISILHEFFKNDKEVNK